jgi:hypothetical protein
VRLCVWIDIGVAASYSAGDGIGVQRPANDNSPFILLGFASEGFNGLHACVQGIAVKKQNEVSRVGMR